MTLISACPKLTNPNLINHIELDKVLEQIQNNDTPLLARVRQGDQEAKKLLPCVIFSGTFTKRSKHALIKSSGYMVLDFDKVTNPTLFRDSIFTNNLFVKASFLSPTGTGVKVLVRIPEISTEPEFIDIFNSLLREFPTLDISGKDLARVCFMSYDPDIKIRQDATTIYTPTQPPVFENPITEQLSENEIIDKLSIWFHKKYSLVEGQRNNSIFALSCALFRYGVEDHYHILKNLDSGLPENELKAIYNSADKSSSHNSVVFEPKKKTKIIKKTEEAPDNYEIDYSILDYEDIQHIITDVLKYTVRTNEVTKRLEINGSPITDNIENIMYAKIDSYIRKNGYSKKSPNKQIFLSALSNLAQREYNPIKETLENTKWDGVSRLDSLCLCLKDKHNVGSTYLYHWMLGAIERVYNTYQNPILVLDGPQKIGKSSLVNFLGQPFKKYYVADGSLDPDNKDDKLAMCENFIYNWEEGASFSKRQMESVKSLVFSESQRIRRSYGKYDEDFKLNASIIMPKNQGEFLTDVTGNRRYNIVQLDVIDFSYNQFDSLQVWAEAYHIWQEDKAKNWQKIDTQKRDEINESMMVTPALYDTLDIVLVKGDESDFVSNNDLYNELQRRDRTFDRNKMSKTIVNYCITKKYERLRKHQGRGFTGCRLEILPYNY